jgi:hypothetical protein
VEADKYAKQRDVEACLRRGDEVEEEVEEEHDEGGDDVDLKVPRERRLGLGSGGRHPYPGDGECLEAEGRGNWALGAGREGEGGGSLGFQCLLRSLFLALWTVLLALHSIEYEWSPNKSFFTACFHLFQ